MSDVKKQEIARKNDQLRKTILGGKVMLTCGVQNHPKRDEIIRAVQGFSDFNEDNDPWNEHDCAVFKVEGEDFMFKIDYYDADYKYFQEDGHRVLTVMRSEDY